MRFPSSFNNAKGDRNGSPDSIASRALRFFTTACARIRTNFECALKASVWRKGGR